jgi:hypothetical protein
MTTTRLAAVALVAAAALVPATAGAAPDHTGSVDAAKTAFNWDSKLGSGFTTLSTQHDGKVPCGTAALHDCDDTLIHVTGCGSLQVTNTGGPPAIDTDLYTYVSNAAGEKVEAGPSSAQSTPTPNESTSIDLPAPDSYILVEIDYTDNVDPGGSVKGTATYVPPTDPYDPETCIPLDAEM